MADGPQEFGVFEAGGYFVVAAEAEVFEQFGGFVAKAWAICAPAGVVFRQPLVTQLKVLSRLIGVSPPMVHHGQEERSAPSKFFRPLQRR